MDKNKAKPSKGALVPVERVEQGILLLRGKKVMLDADLAVVYGTTTKALNQAVKRNAGRFPEDFMFRLTRAEKERVVTNCDHLARLKFSPVLPYAFTEHGAIMVASVLNTQRAIEASVYVVRVFVRLRRVLATHKKLARKLEELEQRVEQHGEAIVSLVETIRELMEPDGDSSGKDRIGFKPKSK